MARVRGGMEKQRNNSMFKIGPFEIGNGRAFVIAEAGVNHNGDAKIAKKLVEAAKEAGADAVKFQSFKAEWMCDHDLTESKAVEGITGGTKSSYDMYKALELSDAAHVEVFEHARKVGITCFSSAFDPRTVDFLLSLKTPAIKIASGDLNYTPLLEKASQTGLPLIVSTGMGTLSEVSLCHDLLSRGKSPFAILQCISEYPLPPDHANLRVIANWKSTFTCPIGFSDHSQGIALPLAAVALGAEIIEKHFTLDNDMAGPDQKMSTNPRDFKAMVQGIRDIEKALGSFYKQPTKAEWKDRHNGRRGIKAGRAIKAGETLKASDLVLIKPATGLAPENCSLVVGKKARRDISRGTPIGWEWLE